MRWLVVARAGDGVAGLLDGRFGGEQLGLGAGRDDAGAQGGEDVAAHALGDGQCALQCGCIGHRTLEGVSHGAL
ncbi:hypothetical protein [Rhodanobacter sp. C06]|uniref:hypothetical protein n=1 Tax=Rhodanobacter sp. C06 TaxID=1945854 RepID=UPI0020C2984A|nr:hypothetical protein [Rhodanobacter sp. C06]